MKTINFSRVDKAKFFRTLNKRVNTYFKENNIKRTGNWKLYSKAVVMFSLFLIPFIVVLSVSMPQWAMVALMVLSGIGMAGVGMNVMHDSNHESFSSKKWVNKLMGSSIYILAFQMDLFVTFQKGCVVQWNYLPILELMKVEQDNLKER